MMVGRSAIVALAVAAAPARASTVMELGPQALYDGADRVVEATVVVRNTIWNPDHSGLETHALLAVESTLKGSTLPTVELVVPGGELDGGRQVVVGMPAVGLGERARWFLRKRGDGSYRVYGWAQGKWPARYAQGSIAYAPAPVLAESDTNLAEFTTNGMIWPASKIPVPYLIQNAGSQDLTLPEVIAAVDAAFATWQAVPCSSLAFQNAGMTDLGQAVDGNNVILFIESGWSFGSESAAATSIFTIAGQQTADIALNGQDFTWAIGPPGPAITSNVLDLQATLTHEIGHFSGLGHTMRAFDTMYYSWSPWSGQRTLSIDDKLGLCSIYGMAGNECPPGCPPDEKCTDHPWGTLCEGTPDPIGTPCNYDRVECDNFCLFTAADLSSGYCSKFCDTDRDCPLTHHCAQASAGTMTVKVCFAGAQPPPPTCSGDADCPAGQYCDAVSAACTLDCRADTDCPSGSTCDDRGRCVGSSGGCGCRSEDDARSTFALLALAAIVRARRPRRPRPRQPQ